MKIKINLSKIGEVTKRLGKQMAEGSKVAGKGIVNLTTDFADSVDGYVESANKEFQRQRKLKAATQVIKDSKITFVEGVLVIDVPYDEVSRS